MRVPGMLLKKLYTFGSLQNSNGGARFSLKNRLTDAELTGILSVKIDREPLDLDSIRLRFDGTSYPAPAISSENPLPFPLRKTVQVMTGGTKLDKGSHTIELTFRARPFGKLNLKVEDAISADGKAERRIPRDEGDDYAEAIVERRQALAERFSGASFRHIKHYSFEPSAAEGNIEHFTGVAQIPLGVAGPLRVEGEHAQGEFLIPLATTEGTLVASYNRGMKVLNLSGGVTSTVVKDAMQRAPVFVFESARAGRDFAAWVEEHLEAIRREAEATSRIARLKSIEPFLTNKFVYLRFNYTTGDAAGQNMVGRATFEACRWILGRYEGIEEFYLESNFATDKKSSYVNTLRTRGKRVTAEAVVEREVLRRHMRVEPERLAHHWKVATVGAFFSGATSNGAHPPNALTALFIATGQDVANIAEASAGLLYSELTPEGDLYTSLTIPSLIVATHGGGTGLPTQRECLEMMGCYGPGKVRKFAEIVAGAVLAGELSLGAAISSQDWVASHERLGRNR